MKVWILTSGFGSGHRCAADALAEEYRCMGHTVEISDVVQLLYPNQAERIYEVFRRVICRHGRLYNAINRIGRGTYEGRKSAAAVQRELERIRPDRVVTTWSGCGRKLGRLEIPVHICITDVGVHAGWLYPHAECYLVAGTETAGQLMNLGISPERIRIRGIPIREEVRGLAEKRGMQKEKHLLIMGGGLGLIPWLEELLRGFALHPELRITVITGKNQPLLEKIRAEYPWVQATGFVDRIQDYLAAADVVISKPGGVSLFESIYATTPYVAMHPVYQHEMENAGFIEENQIGMVIRRRTDACGQILQLLADESRYRSYQTHMAQMKRNMEDGRRQWQELEGCYA